MPRDGLIRGICTNVGGGREAGKTFLLAARFPLIKLPDVLSASKLGSFVSASLPLQPPSQNPTLDVFMKLLINIHCLFYFDEILGSEGLRSL